MREGWALDYRKYSTDYLQAEAAAKRAGAGIWRGEFTPPWEWRSPSDPLGVSLGSAPWYAGYTKGDKVMNQNTAVITAESSRRSFFKLLSGSVLGATALAAHIGGIKRAQAEQFKPLWTSARILIGNSPKDQAPSSSITCPLFFDNGLFANGYHTLDLSKFPIVRGTITINKNTIEPNFGSSIAAADAQGSDGFHYLLVGGEGVVTGGAGYFSGVSKAIVRCKYKVPAYNPLLLVACVDCVIILVWR